MKKINKAIAIVLAVLMAVQITPQVLAAETARTIVIFETEGDDITMTKGTARSYKASVNLRMANGYTTTTGKDSYCWLKLDEESLVKQDQNSKLQFGDASGSKLSISVLSGAITVNAATQKPGESVEVKAGNSALAIRGTIFVVENLPHNRAVITMLTGSGDVNGIPLSAGEVMSIYDTQEKKVYEKRELVVDKNLSLPVLEAILEYIGDIVDAGVVDADEVESVIALIEKLIADKKEQSDEPEYFDFNNEVIRLGEISETGSTGRIEPDVTAPVVVPPVATGLADMINNALAGQTVSVTQPMSIALGETATLRSGAILNIASTLDIDGTLNISPGAIMNIAAGGVVNNNSSNTWNIYGTVDNRGTVNNTATGKITMSGTGVITNRGTISSAAGSAFAAAAGARISQQPGASASGNGLPGMSPSVETYVFGAASWDRMEAEIGGVYYPTLAAALSAGGTVSLVSDTSTALVPGGTTLIVNSGVTLIIVNVGSSTNNGTIINSGTLNVPDYLVNNGLITNNGVMNVMLPGGIAGIGNNSTITNSGVINLYEGGHLNNNGGGSAIVNYASGIIYINDNTSINNTNNFTNEGTIVIANHNNTTLNADSGNFVNTGRIIANGGKINISGGTFTSHAPASITGTVRAAMNITGGTVNIDELDASGGSPYSWVAASSKWMHITENYIAEINGIGYETIAAALNTAANGDTVYLFKSGTLTTNATIKTGVNLNINAGAQLCADTYTLTVESGGALIIGENSVLYGDSSSSPSAIVNNGDIVMKNQTNMYYVTITGSAGARITIDGDLIYSFPEILYDQTSTNIIFDETVHYELTGSKGKVFIWNTGTNTWCLQ